MQAKPRLKCLDILQAPPPVEIPVQACRTAIDPNDRRAPMKTLCAEILRGVGAILLNKKGLRFANELGRRDYLSGAMLEADPEEKTFYILLNSKAAEEANKHVPFYLKKDLLVEHDSLESVADWMHVNLDVLEASLEKYEKDAARGQDAFGKTTFNNLPFRGEHYFAGIVTPAVHYTMGGVRIDAKGRVLSGGTIVPGLFAAGEVTGGVHGNNRLGGNALTECVVFGRIIGGNISLDSTTLSLQTSVSASGEEELPEISSEQLSLHNNADNCWVALHGKVYDMTSFAPDHPAGAESVTKLSGVDGTETFSKVHMESMLDEFDAVGVFKSQ